MLENALWIAPSEDLGEVCPTFVREFKTKSKISRATLEITAVGVYTAYLSGKRIGDFVMAPGWTVYSKRHQVQTYDVTDLIDSDNTLEITVARGWYRGIIAWENNRKMYNENAEVSAIASLKLEYENGESEEIVTDKDWGYKRSALLFCEIYHGEIYDASAPEDSVKPVKVIDFRKDNLIPQEGEKVCEQVHLKAKKLIKTPKGETVIDFGQELTGYVSFNLTAKKGDKVKIKHFEILDKDGNAYTENYRSARATLEYTCKDGYQTYKPTHTFYGFRMIRIEEFPGEVTLENFEAIAVHSDIKRTLWLESSEPLLNRLFSNIEWGQRGNFLDIPTDCPQRDERLGWTGDANVFCRTATYQFDTERFFRKWFGDIRADQTEDGGIPHVVPNVLGDKEFSSVWGDAGIICPWRVYMTYGNKEVLAEQFESMKKWVSYIESHTKEENLWIGGFHFGDWCALDLGYETTDSLSDRGFIASVFYANAVETVAKAGKILGIDVSYYEEKYPLIIKAIQDKYPEDAYKSQTEHALSLYYNVAIDRALVAKNLADKVINNGTRLDTGFVGTPYLLHALAENGYADVAYSLLLQTKFPSWLFSVKQGATTIWEHWDGIKEDGSVWSAGMNSYNHYAYGAVADWVIEYALGIKPVEEAPGFERVVIAPHPDKRIGWLSGEFHSRHGRIVSKWEVFEDGFRYRIVTPVKATVIIEGRTYEVEAGEYFF